MRWTRRLPVVLGLVVSIGQVLGQETVTGARRLEKLDGVEPEPLERTAREAEKETKEAPARTDQESTRDTWLLGKIEPGLEARWRIGGDLEVILYLELAPVAESPAEVRARHEVELRKLSGQLRDLENRYRPAGSVTEEEEKLLVPWLKVAFGQADRDRRDQLNREIDRRLNLARTEVLQVFKQRGAESQAAISELVEAWGGSVLSRVPSVNAIEARIPGTALLDIASHPLVRTVTGRPVPVPELDNSVPSAGYDTWHSNGLTGGGQYDAGLMEGGGLQGNHPYFSGLTIATDGSPLTDTDDSGHGTHVAGIIASGDGTYRGTAPNLGTLFFSNGSSGTFAGFDNLMDNGVTGVSDTPEVINLSSGLGLANDTDYSVNDAFFDAFVENWDTMITKSAGNEGWGTTTVTHPAPAFNILVVANMDDQNSNGRGDDVRRDSSSVGPTLGGRKKPDITAPGTNIRSANAYFEDIGDCNTCGGTGFFGNTCGKDFCEQSGTSMAAPHIAGAIVLLEQGGNHNPEAQKAVLLNTADAWTSNGSSGTGDDGSVSGSHWDKSYGWGYVDMDEAYANRTDYFVDSVVPGNSNGIDDDFKLFKGVMFAGEKATLVWTKRSIYGVSTIPTSNQFDLSDLDLRVYDEVTGNSVDSSTSSIDNVEQVSVSVTTNVILKVNAFSTSFDGATSEEFALATEEFFAQVPVATDFAGYSLGPDTMGPGTQADFNVFMINQSAVGTFNNFVDLQTLPSGWTLVSGSDTQDVGAAGLNQATDLATWRFQARPADNTPPSPSALPWATVPHDLDQARIQMTATVATDEHGPVEYYFEFTSSPTAGTGGSDSGWQTGTSFTDNGLQTNHEYCYRVLPRDGLPVTEEITFSHGHDSYGEIYGPAGVYSIPVELTETANIGTGSAIQCTFTAIDAPTGVVAVTGTSTSLGVRSVNTPVGLDRGSSGLRFLNNTTGTISAWQTTNDPWTASGLEPNTAYEFQARSRNGNGDLSPLSPTASLVTRAAQPAAGPFSVPTDAAIQASWTANGNPSGTEYWAENITTGATSGWTTSLSWITTGLTCGSPYDFRVKARNLNTVETAWVTLGTKLAGLDYDGDSFPNCIDPDDDNDGVADASDCLPLNGSTWTTPTQTRFLVAEHTGGVAGTTTLSWQPPNNLGTNANVVYDTLLSSSQAAWQPGNVACFDLGSDLTTEHAMTPPPGVTLLFLTRAENYCGDGGLGNAVDGTGVPTARSLPGCACEHGICTEGAALDAGCHPCAATLCELDSYCCDTAWDAICIDRVGQVCELSCS